MAAFVPHLAIATPVVTIRTCFLHGCLVSLLLPVLDSWCASGACRCLHSAPSFPALTTIEPANSEHLD